MKKNRQSFPKLRWQQNKPTNPVGLKYEFFAVSVNPSSLDPANNLITVGARHLPTVHCQLSNHDRVGVGRRNIFM